MESKMKKLILAALLATVFTGCSSYMSRCMKQYNDQVKCELMTQQYIKAKYGR